MHTSQHVPRPLRPPFVSEWRPLCFFILPRTWDYSQNAERVAERAPAPSNLWLLPPQGLSSPILGAANLVSRLEVLPEVPIIRTVFGVWGRIQGLMC